MSAPAPVTEKVPLDSLARPATDGLPMSRFAHVDGDVVAAFTVIVAVPDVVRAPALSVATAVTLYVPCATLLQVALYGLDESVPTWVPLAKKSTRETVPST